VKFIYIFYILKEKEKFIDFFGFIGSGIKHLDKKWFKNLEIHLPPLPTQQRIATILSKADEEIELLQKKLNNFETQKKGLMQILLSGRVRFSEFIG